MAKWLNEKCRMFSVIFIFALVITYVAHAYSADVECQVSHRPRCVANFDRDGPLK